MGPGRSALASLCPVARHGGPSCGKHTSRIQRDSRTRGSPEKDRSQESSCSVKLPRSDQGIFYCVKVYEGLAAQQTEVARANRLQPVAFQCRDCGKAKDLKLLIHALNRSALC